MSMFRAFRRRPKSCRPLTLLQQLEERIVLDAAVNAAAQDNPDNHTEPVKDTGAGDATTKAVATPDNAPAGATGVEPPPIPAKYDQVFNQDLNVVLISSALTDVKGISDAAAKDAQVIVYDAAKDSLATIEQKLDAVVETAGQKIDHLAILSHGDAGLLKLTPTSLFTATSVQSNPAEWNTLGTLLAEDARIDIYACSLGQGPAGIALVQSIAQATGAAVWASDDMTGSIAGADWDLEVKSAASNMGSLIDPAAVHTAGLYFSSAPVVDGQSVAVNEDGSLTITVTGSDTDDPDVTKVTFEVTSPVTHGTLSAVGTAVRTEAGHYSQQFLYTPTPDYNGSDSFQFTMKTPKDPVWNGFAAGTAIGADTDYTQSVALGDVNRDGKVDVIAGNWGQTKVYLGNGSGGFTYYGTVCDDYTISVALGDVNGDGKLDIITGNWLASNKVYLGDGSGGFTYHGTVATEAAYTKSVVLGDMNGDGKLDVVVGIQGSSTHTTSKVYLGNGSGGFNYSGSLGTYFDDTLSVALGDVNGDGKLDIITGNNGQNRVYLGDGSGGVTYYGTVGTDGDATRSVALGDVNADGKLDVIAGNSGQAKKVYLGNGSGDFTYYGTVGTDTDSTYSVALGDVNGDGKLDVIAAHSSEPQKIYLGNGSGAFTYYGNFAGSYDNARCIVLGDVNGDGKLDIITGNEGQNNRVNLNNGLDYGGAPFAFSTGSSEGGGTQVTSVSIGDVNRDGKLDVVVGNEDQPTNVFIGDGSGSFIHPSDVNNSTQAVNDYIAGFADLNRDGKIDVAIANTVSWLETFQGNGDATFTKWNDYNPTDRDTRSIAFGDLNRDGIVDIVLGNYAQQSVLWIGNGAGGNSSFSYFADSDYTRCVAIADVNKDGTLDVIQGNDGLNNIKVYYGRGDGVFFPPTGFGVDTDATYCMAVGDVDQDGDPDIVVGNDGSTSKVYFNDGSGNFTTSAAIGTHVGVARSIALQDLNTDGKLDVVVGYDDHSKMVYLGNGSGAFDYYCTLGSDTDKTRAMGVADLNSDGIPDLVAGNYGQLNKAYQGYYEEASVAGTVDITVNDAPTLSSATATLTEITEDATSNSGQQVSVFVEGYGDVNTGALHGIGVTGATGNGHWEWSANGTDWNTISGVISTNALLLDANDYVRYVPDTHNGETATLVYKAWDHTEGTLHGTFDPTGHTGTTYAFSTTDQTASIVVTDVNDLPTAVSQDVAVNEDGTLGITVTGRDVDRPDVSTVWFDIGDNVQHGTLVASGPVVHDGVGNYTQQFTYTPQGNYNGSDSFLFEFVTWNGFDSGHSFTSTFAASSVYVADFNNDGNMDVVLSSYNSDPWYGFNQVYLNDGNGNLTLKSTFGPQAYTHDLAIADLDDDGNLDIVEAVYYYGPLNVYFGDGTGIFNLDPRNYTIGSSPDFCMSVALGDVDGDGHPDLVSASSSGEAGKLFLNNGSGVLSFTRDIAAGETSRSVQLADVDNDNDLDMVVGNENQLSKVYLNDSHGNFSSFSSFGSVTDQTYAVRLGDLNHDTFLDVVAANYNGPNNVYFGDGEGNFTYESSFGTGADTTRGVALIDLNQDGYLDVVEANADNLNRAYLNDGAGSFTYYFPIGSDLSGHAAIQEADLNLDGVMDIVVGNWGGTSSKTFLGISDSSDDATVNITVTPVNDEPTSEAFTATVAEDTSVTLTGFSFSDATDAVTGGSSADSAAFLSLKSLPGNGKLYLDGTELSAVQDISWADVTSGKLTFQGDEDWNGLTGFTFTVKDSGADHNESVATYTASITVTPVNDEPTSEAFTATVAEDTSVTLTGFSFSDATDAVTGGSSADSAAFLSLKSLPGNGKLYLDGTELSAVQDISWADVTSGKLTFQGDEDWNGLTGFTFTVKDSGADHNESVATYTASITVTPVNDEPTSEAFTATVAEDTSVTLTGFSFSDATDAVTGGSSADSAAFLSLKSLPGNGKLYLDGTELSAVQDISWADVTSGKLTFQGDEDWNGLTGFTFTVKDSGADHNESVATYTASITVTPVNDEPTSEAFTATVAEDTSVTLTGFSFSDATDAVTGGSSADSAAFLSLKSLPGNGKLYLDGTELSAVQDISWDDVTSGKLTFQGNADWNGLTAFTFTVKDSGADNNESVAMYGAGITVTPVNDAPVLSLSSGAGTLDPTFSGDGKVSQDGGGSSSDVGRAVAIQSDGKIVMAGWSGGNFALARYNTDGSPDSTFDPVDHDGIVTTDFGGDDRGYAVAIQPDGKILVAGTSGVHIALARYNIDGSLDSSFDGDGMVTTDLANNSEAWSVAMQPDGKIVVAGGTWGNSIGWDFAIARYNTNGSPDASFGVDGKVQTDFGFGSDSAQAVIIRPDGKIVVAGYADIGSSNYDFALACYNTDGSLDNSFGGDGRVTTNFGGQGDFGFAGAMQADGKIVVGGFFDIGSGNNSFALARYNTDGSLDNSFDVDGRVITDFGGGLNNEYAYGVAIQPDGKIVLAGSYGHDFALARYDTNGSPDTSFDVDGKLLTDFGPASQGYSVAIQPDGKIVAVGKCGEDPSDFALARFHSGLMNYNENDAPRIIDNEITLTDVDNANMVSAVVRISGNWVPGEDVLAFTNFSNITGTWHGDTGVLNLDGIDTVANYEAALRSVKYENTSESPDTGARTVTWTVYDGAADSTSQTTTITVTAVNDAPTLSSATATLTGINEDAVSNSGQQISAFVTGYGDVDAGALHGIGVTGVTGNGQWEWSANGTDWNTISGVTSTNAFLLEANDYVRYVPDTHNGETATLIYKAWDHTEGALHGTFDPTGHTGTTYPFSTADQTASIVVTDVNDAPVAVDDSGFSTDQNSPLVIPAASVLSNDTDVDQPPQILTIAGLTYLNPTGNLSAGVAVGDVNNDGKPDIILGNYGEPSGVYLNDGHGGFVHFGEVNPVGDPILYPGVNYPYTNAVAVGDLNNDGKLDVILGNDVGQPTGVYLGVGDGTFTYSADINAGNSTNTVLLADFNGDTNLDVVLANSLGESSAVYLGNGDGTFGTPTELLSPLGTPFYWTTGAALGDIDGDGATDIVLANYGDPSAVYFGDGAGNFTYHGDVNPLDEVINPNWNIYASGAALGDVNGDGNLDVVLANWSGLPTEVYAGDGAGGFAYQSELAPVASQTWGVALEDLNGDGNLDIVLANSGEPSAVYVGAGDGTFTHYTDLNPPGNSTDTVAIGDLDGDGNPDIVLANGYGETSEVYYFSQLPAASSGAIVTLSADGQTITYDPNHAFDYLAAGESTTDTFTYQVKDDLNAVSANTATVTVTVTGLNDAPVAVEQAGATSEDSILNGSGLLDGATDVDNGHTLSTVAENGTSYLGAAVTIGTDGTYTYDPTHAAQLQSLAEGASDFDYFTYTVTDEFGATDTETVTITVGGVNDAPVLTVDSAGGVTEDVSTPNLTDSGVLSFTDADTNGTHTVSHSYNSDAVWSGGSLTAEQVIALTDGFTADSDSWDYTVANSAVQFLGQGETVVFGYDVTVTDNLGGSDTKTVTITVAGVNDAPVAADHTGATDEDTVLNGTGLLAGATDVDNGHTLNTVAWSGTSASGAAVTIDEAGNYTYDPRGSDTLQELAVGGTPATDTFSYTVTDEHDATDTKTVTITVGGLNDAPVAADHTGSTDEDTLLNANMLVGATDVDTGASLHTVPGSGTSTLGAAVTIDADGNGTYDPRGSETLQALAEGGTPATDTFSYTVIDEHDATDTKTVTITVAGVNDAPVAGDDNISAVDGAAAASHAPELPLPDLTTTIDDLVVSGLSGSIASLTATLDISHTNVYDVEIYLVSPSGTWVKLFNHAHAGGYADFSGTVFDDSAAVSIADGSAPFIGHYRPIEPLSTFNGENANGTWQLYFADTARWDSGTLHSLSLNFVETGVPITEDAPVSFSTAEVLANDTDVDNGAALTVTGVSVTPGVIMGDAWLGLDGMIHYDPNGQFETLAQGETATDTFTYTVADEHGATDTATVTVTITGVNDVPVANDDVAYTVSEDGPSLEVAAGGVLINDTDVDSPHGSLTAQLVDGPAKGALTFNTDGSFTYDPNGDFESLAAGATEPVTFTYKTIDDNSEESNVATVTITVNGVNDAPVANDDVAYTVSEDGPSLEVAAGGVLTNDTDVDSAHASLTAQLVDGPAKGLLTFNTDGSFTYYPNGEFESLAIGDHEDVTFTYKTIDDQSAESNVATVTITVTGVNDAPVLSLSTGGGALAYAENDGPRVIDSAVTITDVDNANMASATIQITGNYHSGEDSLSIDDGDLKGTTSSWHSDTGTLTLTGSASKADYDYILQHVKYTNSSESPVTDPRTVTWTVNDGIDNSTPQDTTFTVTAVNDAPVNTVPIAVQEVNADGELTFSTANGNLISISDVDAGTGLLKVTLTATNGTITLNGAFLTGLSFDPALGGQGDGTADATMTFLGTQTDINNALNGMRFTHDAGFYGMADVTINVSDQGNTGSGGDLSSAPGVTNISVEPYNTWFHGFGTESGWEVYNHADTNISYYSHDYTVLWQHVTATDTWNLFNGSDWVGTNDLGNAPYADGYGPFGTWFPDNVTGGTYNGYEVYIHANGVTEFSLDHTAPGATYWQVTSAGSWTYFDGSDWYSTTGFNVGPDNVWYHGFGTESGWNVYNHAATNISYYTHDHTVLWQHVNSTNTWNFFNGTDWVGTNGLGNAPYADGYGLFGTWFPDNVTGGTYNGYEVYIHANGVTEFCLDHTAPGAQYWQVTGAGAWTYFDGSAWYSTAGFNVGPDNVWYHGFGADAGWNVYNHAATNISYYTHDYVSLWQHVNSTNTWNFFDGSAWYATTGLNVGPVDVWYHGFGTYAGWEVYNHAATNISYYTHTYVTLWQHVTATDAWNYFDGTVWMATTGLGVIV